MNTTKRQSEIFGELSAIATSEGLESVEGLGVRLRTKGISDATLKALAKEVPLDAQALALLESAIEDLKSWASPVRHLITRATRTGITQAIVAERIGVSPVTLSRWASGVYKPRASSLEDLEKLVAELEEER